MRFYDKKTTYIQDEYKKAKAAGVVPSSRDIGGIEIRMLPPYIRDNSTVKIWPFPGNAKLYCLTIVISDAANQLTGYLDLNTFPAVGDHEYLPINKTIYYWEPQKDKIAPGQVHVFSSIIKSRENLRDSASIIEAAKNDYEYRDVIDMLSSVVSETASSTLVANMSLQIADIVAKYLGKINDKPIGTAINSFTRLHGDWDKVGITPVKMSTKNIDFNFEVIVRDGKRFPVSAYETMPFSTMVPIW